MSFRISGQNLDVGEALRDRIAEAMIKYFDGGYSGHLTLVRDGFGFRSECAVHLDSKITLHAEGMASDAYASAEQAAARIEKRLRRYHRRLKDHRPERQDERTALDAASYVIAAPERDEDDEIDGFTPVVIRIDHQAQAIVGQRRGHGARYDGRSGHRLSACQTRRHQCRVPALRRPFRLDRCTARRRLRIPLTGL